MAGYVLADVTWTDDGARRRYIELIGPTLKTHGGEVVASDREAQVMEGDWQPGGITVLIAFPTRAAASNWYHSEDYREALETRARSSSSRLIILGD